MADVKIPSDRNVCYEIVEKKERTPGFPHGQTQELFTRQSGYRRYLKKVDPNLI